MTALTAVAAEIGARLRGDDADVDGVTIRDSDVRPGWIFAALPGLRHHGIEFAGRAAARGAAAILSDRDPGRELPWLHAPEPREATARAAWLLAGHPEHRLRLVGVTGTNGKTTVCDLVGRIAAAAGEPAGVFGTLAYALPGRRVAATRTTPEATDLAPLLRELVDGGGRLAALEISSHALALGRVAALPVDVAVWTNLSRDHLDYHADMDAYFAAKRGLESHLRRDPPGRRVVNADDPFMARLLDEPRAGDVPFGLGTKARVTADDVRLSTSGTRFLLRTPAGDAPVALPLVGRHNLANALAAAAAGHALGWPASVIAAGLAAAQPLPGRLEPVDTGTPYPVFVDYAHTPDALEKVLTSLREVTDRKLIVVFGCGGDRDRGKRPLMGAVVARLADVPIVTSDNPRTEEPEAIIAAVLEGVRSAGNIRALAIADRREAIAAALSVADSASLVLIAGKGHETEQVFADRTVPFDDAATARELAHRRRG